MGGRIEQHAEPEGEPGAQRAARAVGERRVGLPGGRELLIRPVASDDVDALVELYDSLDAAARYRRFFSVFRPPRSFFERLVAVDARGGAGLVALVTEADGAARLVGEACYEPLPNGDGELAITVDGRWRGWLGPMLLDALVQTAAERGVPNLLAEVLLTNGPMLSLLRSRGYAVIPQGDWTIVRALIGTSGPVPTWPVLHDHPRLLVEEPSGHWQGAAAAAKKGVDVVVCPGPSVRHRHECPVLAGRPCPLAEGADAILLCNPSDSEEWNALRKGHEEVHPGVPVFVAHAARRRSDDVLPSEQDVSDDPDQVVDLLAGRGGGSSSQ
jgi:hypothetical protein